MATYLHVCRYIHVYTCIRKCVCSVYCVYTCFQACICVLVYLYACLVCASEGFHCYFVHVSSARTMTWDVHRLLVWCIIQFRGEAVRAEGEEQQSQQQQLPLQHEQPLEVPSAMETAEPSVANGTMARVTVHQRLRARREHNKLL